MDKSGTLLDAAGICSEATIVSTPWVPDSVKMYRLFEHMLSDEEKAMTPWYREATECAGNPHLNYCATKAICDDEKWIFPNGFIKCNDAKDEIIHIKVDSFPHNWLRLRGTLKFKNIPHSVQKVAIFGQQIQSVDFSESVRLESLEVVYLNKNGIRFANFKELKAPKLRILDFWDNNFSGTLKVADLQKCPNLKEINLDQNDITAISFDGVTQFSWDYLNIRNNPVEKTMCVPSDRYADTCGAISPDNWIRFRDASGGQ